MKMACSFSVDKRTNWVYNSDMYWLFHKLKHRLEGDAKRKDLMQTPSMRRQACKKSGPRADRKLSGTRQPAPKNSIYQLFL